MPLSNWWHCVCFCVDTFLKGWTHDSSPNPPAVEDDSVFCVHPPPPPPPSYSSSSQLPTLPPTSLELAFLSPHFYFHFNLHITLIFPFFILRILFWNSPHFSPAFPLSPFPPLLRNLCCKSFSRQVFAYHSLCNHIPLNKVFSNWIWNAQLVTKYGRKRWNYIFYWLHVFRSDK